MRPGSRSYLITILSCFGNIDSSSLNLQGFKASNINANHSNLPNIWLKLH